MQIANLRIGMKVRHPMYGEGEVTAIRQQAADVTFDGVVKTVSPETSGLEPCEPEALLSGLSVSLEQLIAEIVDQTVSELGLEDPNQVVEGLASKWGSGTLLLKPSNPELQSKELPIETFFHKMVMVRNNLRVLEQKINAHQGLSEADKVELQQYITRSYGSLTTFNVLFKSKEDQFSSR